MSLGEDAYEEIAKCEADAAFRRAVLAALNKQNQVLAQLGEVMARIAEALDEHLEQPKDVRRNGHGRD